jgi:hypothetical protein
MMYGDEVRHTLCFRTKPKEENISGNVGVVGLTLPSYSSFKSLFVIISGASYIKDRFGERSSCRRPL